MSLSFYGIPGCRNFFYNFISFFFLYLIYGCSDVEILMEIYLQASWTLVRFFDRMK